MATKEKHAQEQQKYREKLKRKGKLEEYRAKHRNFGQQKRSFLNWLAKPKNKIKRKAHLAVQVAIESGKLTKLPCEICGVEGKNEAHHSDYTKPLSVKWLCRKHHIEQHKGGERYEV